MHSRIEILRNFGHERAWRRRCDRLLLDEHLERGCRRTEGVPVSASKSITPTRYQSASAVDRGSGGLLRRHVGEGADDVQLHALELSRSSSVTRPKSSSDDAAFARHEHVRRLDVAVDAPAAWSAATACGELARARGAAHLVEVGALGSDAPAPSCRRQRRRERAAGDERGLRRLVRVRRTPGVSALAAIHGRFAGAHVVEEVDAVDELHREEPLAALLERARRARRGSDAATSLQRAELALEAEKRVAVDVPTVFSATRANARDRRPGRPRPWSRDRGE